MASLLLVLSVIFMGARSVSGLGFAGSFEHPPDAKSSLMASGNEDLMRAGKGATEEDALDTWMFANAGAGPEAHPPSKKEVANYTQTRPLCQTPGVRENGVIAFLVTRPSDLVRLKESLPRLTYHLLRKWKYPVRIFIPSRELREYDNESYGDSPDYDTVMKNVKKFAGFETLEPVYDFAIETFDFKFPDVIARDENWRLKMNGCAQAVGTSYKHMNQFFTKGMYEHPSLDSFRYYMRIDADFNFVGPIEEDPFCMMAKTGRKFMWQTRKVTKDPRCIDGLWEWFEQYAKLNNLTGKDTRVFKAKGAQMNYVGYAGMGDLDFFRSEPVRKIAKALNDDGRIYLNRWSDQTYYPLLFALFEEHAAVGDIGFAWPHSSWCHKCWVPEEPFDPVTGKAGSVSY